MKSIKASTDLLFIRHTGRWPSVFFIACFAIEGFDIGLDIGLDSEGFDTEGFAFQDFAIHSSF